MQRLVASPARLALVVLSLLSLSSLWACGSSEPTSDPSTATPPSPQTPPLAPEVAPEAAPDLHAASQAQGASYALDASGDAHYAVGELSQFGIALSPRGEWHVNQEYPLHVELVAEDGVSLPKSELERADAAEFGERGVRFDVPFSAAAAGDHRVAAKVSFAMCTAENCMLQEQTVALALPIQ